MEGLWRYAQIDMDGDGRVVSHELFEEMLARAGRDSPKVPWWIGSICRCGSTACGRGRCGYRVRLDPVTRGEWVCQPDVDCDGFYFSQSFVFWVPNSIACLRRARVCRGPPVGSSGPDPPKTLTQKTQKSQKSQKIRILFFVTQTFDQSKIGGRVFSLLFLVARCVFRTLV